VIVLGLNSSDIFRFSTVCQVDFCAARQVKNQDGGIIFIARFDWMVIYLQTIHPGAESAPRDEESGAKAASANTVPLNSPAESAIEGNYPDLQKDQALHQGSFWPVT